MTQSITVPSAEQQLEIACNNRARAHESLLLNIGQKYACVLLPLTASVEPSDYAAINAAVESITGVQSGVTLLIDGETPASVPEGKQVRLVVDAHMRIETIPEV